MLLLLQLEETINKPHFSGITSNLVVVLIILKGCLNGQPFFVGEDWI